MAQVDKANDALDKYLTLPCASEPKDIKAVSANLTAEMNNLRVAYQNLPSGQDNLVQARERRSCILALLNWLTSMCL
jgi:hypothetical protein